MSGSLYKLSQKVGTLLKEKGFSLAVAESCTGGLFSSSITDIPGSSQYFILGVVAYSSVEKEKVLKIPKSVIKRYSAVSPRVCQLMAENVRKIAKADIGLGITGYAGPGGGSLKNPVGVVYVSLAFKGKRETRKYFFKGRRQDIKKKAVREALLRLYKKLKSQK